MSMENAKIFMAHMGFQYKKYIFAVIILYGDIYKSFESKLLQVFVSKLRKSVSFTRLDEETRADHTPCSVDSRTNVLHHITCSLE